MKTSLILLLLSVACHQSDAQTPDEGFYNFLSQAMLDYPAWAVANGLEPSQYTPAVDLTTDTGFYNLTGEIRNQLLYNLSNFDDLYVSSNLLGAYFEIRTDGRETFSIEGEYDIEGTLFNSIPVKGSGHFNSTPSWETYVGVHGIRFENLRIVNDHIVLSEEQARAGWAGWNDLELKFEGLDAGGYEESVREMLQEKHFEHRWEIIEAIAERNFRKYFEELFEATPLSEIIGTTMPPTMAPTTNATTEDPPVTYTTSNPCKGELGNPNIQIVKEEVLSKETVMEDGKMVVYTTKVVKLREIL